MGARGPIGASETELKLHGSYRKGRHANRSKEPGSLGLSFAPVDVPEWLQYIVDADAMQFWSRVLPDLDKGKQVADLDIPAFALLSSAWKWIHECDVKLETEGFTLTSARGVTREHPLCKVRARYVQEFLALADSFGITPKARRRLGVNLKPPEKSKLDKFRNAQ